MDKETKELFNALVTEMDRRFDRMETRFDSKLETMNAKIDWVYEALSHEINACRLDRDILMKVVDKTEELDKRVSVLEKRSGRQAGIISFQSN